MSRSTSPIEFRIKAQSIGFFETPVAICQLSEAESLLDDIERKVRERRNNDPGVTRSNVGSWHSDTNMLEWGGESAKALGEKVVSIARRMSYFKGTSPDAFNWLLQMWANITPPGGMNDLHAHPGNLWAAVLYLDMGRSERDEPAAIEDAGGNFFIEDPRFPLNVMHNTGFRIMGAEGKPQEIQQELRLNRGDVIIFPAWLRHGVRPYTGDRERISVAIKIDAVPMPR